MNTTQWIQKEIMLQPRDRGIHLVTAEIQSLLPEISLYSVGISNFLLLHTSAGLALNECIEPEVRTDLETYLDGITPEGAGLYRHAYEGIDDMPAHIKSVLTGVTLTLPVADGEFRLGTWQGIYLCEFRKRGGARRILATIHGEQRSS